MGQSSLNRAKQPVASGRYEERFRAVVSAVSSSGQAAGIVERLSRDQDDPAVWDDARAWLRLGQALHAEGEEPAADRAFVIALSIDADLIEARRARRRLVSRDVSLRPEHLSVLQGAFAGRLIYRRSSQVTSGNGANTEYVARHEFEREDGAPLALLEKSFILDGDELPREAAVYREAGALPKGTLFRFPTLHGFVSDATGCSVFTEFIDRFRAPMPALFSLSLRAKALGEMSGSSLSPDVAYEFLKRPTHRRKISAGRLRAFRDTLPRDEYSGLHSLFCSIDERLREMSLSCPRCLNKGDSQAANLIHAQDGQIVMIDLGGMDLDYVGSDLGGLVMTYLAGAKGDALERGLDIIAVKSFYEHLGPARSDIDPRAVSIGMLSKIFYLVYCRIVRKSFNEAGRSPELFSGVATERAASLKAMLSFIASRLSK